VEGQNERRKTGTRDKRRTSQLVVGGEGVIHAKGGDVDGDGPFEKYHDLRRAYEKEYCCDCVKGVSSD
jgi:hypothetical protein